MDVEARSAIVVVDDEESVADAYVAMLQTEYNVQAAYGGKQALELIDDSIDVVLLDRRMPEITGDDVLAELVTRGVDTRVIVTTAVEPTTDILEMPFQDYLCKPVDMETLRTAVAQQVEAAAYDETLQEFLETEAKIGVLERKKPPTQLESNEQYQAYLVRHRELEQELAKSQADFEAVTTGFREIDRA